MCVDAMWYGTLREGKVDLYLGFKGYSYEEVLVGAISSLMVFPINMILILIFRNCRLPKSRVSFFLIKMINDITQGPADTNKLPGESQSLGVWRAVE